MAKAKSKPRQSKGRTAPRRVGLATIALGVVTLAAVGSVLWLTLSADTTMERLRASADRESLHAVIDIAPAAAGPTDGAATIGSETGPTGGNTAEAEPTPLPPAPIEALIQASAIGPLPRIAADGRTPWQTYARPFDAGDTRPRIAIVITDMGHAHAPTNAAIRRLPGPVTLAFTPYAPDLEAWLTAAREAGHETLIMLPMEPETYPRDDPGPHTLLTSLGPSVNRERLEWVLSRGGGYVGVVTEMGSRFAGSEEALEPVLGALGDRGLLMLDNGSTVNSRIGTMAGRFGLPQVTGNRQIDADADRDAIDLRLQELEDLARENGFAVGLAHPYPLTFERLAAWIPSLERKGIVLAPITAVANRPGTG